jgi:DNA polymerase III subunit epsilon
MGLLDRLFRRTRDGHQRWIVVDVETSGMDIQSDALISIGAVAMHADGHVVPGDSIEIVVQQGTASSRENILVHGVGVEAQLNGVASERWPSDMFMEFVSTAPIIAFHAPFDRGVPRSIGSRSTTPTSRSTIQWLDLAELAPALEPKAAAAVPRRMARPLPAFQSQCAIARPPTRLPPRCWRRD